MKLTVLTENVAGGQLLAEHGLSYLIECDGRSVLFDTGHSDVFLKNAKKLGIDIRAKIKTIVLSHGHWDHGDGLRYLQGQTLITHPSSFLKRYRKNDPSRNIGLTLSRPEVENKFDLIVSEIPCAIDQNMIFLGEIPRLNDFEAQATPFVDENGWPDFVPDDSAIAILQDDGLIVVTGCSHAGICNIVEYAKKVSGRRVVKAVVGGFHLKRNNRQTEKTIQYFRDHGMEAIFPSHCTELPALAAFQNAFEINQVKTGMILNF
ncbi:MAG: MBL fold metallo-hydrolase [Cytophagales bacterium]|nr:MBL fold metallo-hydrolase [Cytophagales bacterium]